MSKPLAAEVMFSGGSPVIYEGEERFSAPENAALYRCALALGTNSGVCAVKFSTHHRRQFPPDGVQDDNGKIFERLLETQ